MKLRPILGFFGLLIALLLPGQADAQEILNHNRQGMIIGFSVGGGRMQSLNCDECGSINGGAGAFWIGGMVNHRLALMYDANFVVSEEDGVVLLNGVNAFAAQFWILPRLWIKGGAGFGQIRLSALGVSATEYGFGLTAAAGLEVMQRETFAMDVQLRYASSHFDAGGLLNVSAMLGFNWY